MSDLAIQRLLVYLRNPTAPQQAIARGARGSWVANVWHALRSLEGGSFDSGLSHEPSDADLFDSKLEEAVCRFQRWQHHTSCDGVLGPGTQRLLAKVLWERAGARYLSILERARPDPRPRAFLSHASADSATVEVVEAFLSDHGVQVARYTHSFIPGDPIIEDVEEAIAQADKIVVFDSAAARNSEWVGREIALAQELERAISRHLLIYVVLGRALDSRANDRIAVQATGRPLGEVGAQLLRALFGPTGPPRQGYDLAQPL